MTGVAVCLSLYWFPYPFIGFFILFLANLLQDLNSPDPAVKESAIAETEKRLREQEAGKEEESKTTVNRTVINTRASVRAFPFRVKAVCSSGIFK